MRFPLALTAKIARHIIKHKMLRTPRFALVLQLEVHAWRLGRTTLVLDTREGDPAETLYASAGWTRVGAIPRYAESAGGSLDGSAFYYKLLKRGTPA